MRTCVEYSEPVTLCPNASGNLPGLHAQETSGNAFVLMRHCFSFAVSAMLN
jgi:hypothetical protein